VSRGQPFDAEGGVDTDGNGVPEIFALGNGPQGWTTIVYEARCNDSFTRIATFSQNDGATGEVFKTMARLQGAPGPWSYLMGGFQHFWIYRSTAHGSWSLIAEVPTTDPLLHGLYAFDLNRNGRDEVLWTSDDSSSLVLEAPSGATDSAGLRPPTRFAIAPSPARGAASIVVDLETSHRARAVAVFDVMGRLVERRGFDCRDPATQRWPAAGLASGIYLFRLEDGSGRSIATTRATVLR
jgi:hypothetical protein